MIKLSLRPPTPIGVIGLVPSCTELAFDGDCKSLRDKAERDFGMVLFAGRGIFEGFWVIVGIGDDTKLLMNPVRFYGADFVVYIANRSRDQY